MTTEIIYSTVIVGSGPFALAVLSRLHESVDDCYRRLNNQEIKPSVYDRESCANVGDIAVVDPSGSWLQNWKDQFRSLGICFLRSPIIAHSNVKDHLALLEYIAGMEKSSEHIKLSSLEFRGRSEDFNSQFGQPSLKSFLDFSSDLAKSLPHTMVTAVVVDIVKEKGLFKLLLSNGLCLRAKAVVVSPGQGRPYVPGAFLHLVNETTFPPVVHSSQLSSIELRASNVCVVGGGSSAALCAIKAVSAGAKNVVMIHRRELQSRQFELRQDWLSPKKGLLHFEFFNQETAKEKVAFIRRERSASITPHEMSQLKRFEEMGRLQMRVGEIAGVEKDAQHGLIIHLEGSESIFCEKIVLATGFRNDCNTDPLLSKILSRFPIDTTEGFPNIETSLRWKAGMDLFIVGSYAALELGPEAFNMMGAARAARIIGSSLVTVPKNFTGNSFSALQKKKQQQKKNKSLRKEA